MRAKHKNLDWKGRAQHNNMIVAHQFVKVAQDQESAV
jgi:hypothetical protein